MAVALKERSTYQTDKTKFEKTESKMFYFNNGFDRCTKQETVNRGEVWLVRLDGSEGSEQGGIRPCLVISNNIGNKYSSIVTVAAMSTKLKKKLPTHVIIESDGVRLEQTSVIMCEQLRTVDKCRLIHKLTYLTGDEMAMVKNAYDISCGM